MRTCCGGSLSHSAGTLPGVLSGAIHTVIEVSAGNIISIFATESSNIYEGVDEVKAG
jgi:hypothetical protein